MSAGALLLAGAVIGSAFAWRTRIEQLQDVVAGRLPAGAGFVLLLLGLLVAAAGTALLFLSIPTKQKSAASSPTSSSRAGSATPSGVPTAPATPSSVNQTTEAIYSPSPNRNVSF